MKLPPIRRYLSGSLFLTDRVYLTFYIWKPYNAVFTTIVTSSQSYISVRRTKRFSIRWKLHGYHPTRRYGSVTPSEVVRKRKSACKRWTWHVSWNSCLCEFYICRPVVVVCCLHLSYAVYRHARWAYVLTYRIFLVSAIYFNSRLLKSRDENSFLVGQRIVSIKSYLRKCIWQLTKKKIKQF